MKKIILLLATFALYANAINCLEATMLSDRFEAYGYKMDSAIVANGSLPEPWYTYSKYIYSSDELTLNIECEDNSCDTLVYKSSFDATKNLKISVSYWKDYLQDSLFYYIDKDSIVWISTQGSTTYTEIRFLRNDTLYEESYKTFKSTNLTDQSYIVMDPSDNNKCYEYTSEGTLTDGSIQIEIEGSLLTVKQTTQEFGASIFDIYYFSKFDDGITAIHKYHPASAIKQYHYYDLMGRPAKGKNIIKVVK